MSIIALAMVYTLSVTPIEIFIKVYLEGEICQFQRH